MQAANDNSAPANAGAHVSALRFLSVCFGIEAASCAWPQWQAVAFAEIEKFPSAVLAHHYPDVPNLGDFTAINTSTLGRVDVLCGGTPCQAFSVAGLRQSLDDARGNLSLEFVRLAHELADGNGLRNTVWENVPGVLSTKDNAFGCFLAGLVGATDALPPPTDGRGKKRRWPNAGMVAGPKGRAAWRVLDAQYFGLAQRRKRVIVVADFGNGADPAAVLFEPESVRRDSPPSREAGQGVAADVAPSPTASGRGVERTGDTRGQDPVVATFLHVNKGRPNGRNSAHEEMVTLETETVPTLTTDGHSRSAVAYAPEIARCVATREGSSQDYESTTMVAVGVTGQISHALKAEGADASEDGTGRGTPIVATSFARQSSFADQGAEEISGTLVKNQIMGVHIQAQTVAPRGREGGATAELGGEVATALRASSGGGDRPHVLAACGEVWPALQSHAGSGYCTGQEQNAGAYLYGSAVRRLTPRECERLMGFPDDYTRIPYRNKPASACPDGPRYKALGNSWAVPLFAWLGQRIEMYMPAVMPIAANDNNQTQVTSLAA